MKKCRLAYTTHSESLFQLGNAVLEETARLREDLGSCDSTIDEHLLRMQTFGLVALLRSTRREGP